jgi:hypothetical protein
VAPAFEKLVQADKAAFERFLREVPQAFRDELTVFIEIFDSLGDNGGLDAV